MCFTETISHTVLIISWDIFLNVTFLIRNFSPIIHPSTSWKGLFSLPNWVTLFTNNKKFVNRNWHSLFKKMGLSFYCLYDLQMENVPYFVQNFLHYKILYLTSNLFTIPRKKSPPIQLHDIYLLFISQNWLSKISLECTGVFNVKTLEVKRKLVEEEPRHQVAPKFIKTDSVINRKLLGKNFSTMTSFLHPHFCRYHIC